MKNKRAKMKEYFIWFLATVIILLLIAIFSIAFYTIGYSEGYETGKQNEYNFIMQDYKELNDSKNELEFKYSQLQVNYNMFRKSFYQLYNEYKEMKEKELIE